MQDLNLLKSHSFFKGINWDKLLKKEISPPIKPRITGGTDTRHFDEEFTKQNVDDSFGSGNLSSYLYPDFTYIVED